ncbi:MAG: hypothetical protein M3Y60_02220 [Bacteroidota bacterium]|nr:hypothetical protein [Bacteroidota bacterium]
MPILLLALALLLPKIIFAQAKQFPDSIRVELPEQGAIVIIELRVYGKDKEIVRNFPSRLSEIAGHVSASIPESQWTNAHKVVVSPDKTDDQKATSKITITKKDDVVTRVRVKGTTVLELLPPGWEVTIHTQRSVVHVYAPDFRALEAIGRLSFEPVLAYLETQDEFVHEKRMGVFTRVVMEGDKITPAGGPGRRLPADMLGLHAGAALGIVGDRIFPEFNFLTAIYLANQYQENRQRIAAGYELKLFSGRTEDNSFRSTPASFVTLSYGINFRGGRPRWTAVGAGFLVHNKSDLFTGKTLKLFLESDIGSEKLNIVPELYLTDGYKKSIFGIKLNYKF